MEKIENLKQDIKRSVILTVVILVVFGLIYFLETSQQLLTRLFF